MINEVNLKELGLELVGEKDIETPKYTCKSCKRCNVAEKRCNFHQRRIEPNYNKCFEHSVYSSSPIKAIFTPLPDEVMDALVKQNEAAYA